MNRHHLPPAMREALSLTRAGRVLDATRAIQQALGGVRPPAADPAAEPAPDGAPRLAPPAGRGPSARPRRPLGSVIAALREGRRALELPGLRRRAPRPVPEPVPEGARFEARIHGGEAGSRRYKLYVPAGAAASRPRGLVLMLHGCTQDPDDFAAGTRMNAHAETHGLIVAYPAQEHGASPNLCWNWFSPAHQARGAGEPEILAGLARSLAAEYGVADDRVFAAGLSAGGAMAAVLGREYPELFAAIGVHSGLPAGAASDVVSAFAAMRGDGRVAPRATGGGARTIVIHGAADETVHVSNAERIAAGVHPDAGTAPPEHGEANGRRYRRVRITQGDATRLEVWTIDGAGHAWSGGSPAGSYADAAGPDASREMVRFFLEG
ncbi:extracellular catalytic domain type 1 short-chain-length polyhydroxyalkanoate depolymerase [Salinarimonas chemoclinalis]|uniref:extracellular catalytic domain type 1 short-chain-length polyhydroxyalkanoate depolymerase n=1 Tax=Salinarimonas chemoclinalis TaxID=3241599 RepID=UPI0035578C8F